MEADPKVLQALQASVAYAEKAQPLIEKAAQDEAAAAKLVPEVVDNLIKAGYLVAEQREKAATSLTSHVKALEALNKLAAVTQTAKAAAAPPSLGAPVALAAPAATGGTVKESEQIWQRAFGR